MPKMVRFTVTLNGTDKNPFEIYGVKQNPFPQVARYEYTALNQLLANLAAEPIRDTDHLRERMKGADPKFIDGCCERFRKGEVVKFDIQFPEN